MADARRTPAARVASVMRTSPYLRGLPELSLRRLAAAAQRRRLPAGTTLETGLEPALYLVVSGEVSGWTPADRDGVAEIVGQEGPGAVFGSGALTGEAEVPIFRAATAVEVCVWGAADLDAVYAADEGLRRQLAARLSLRSRERELVDLLRRTPLFIAVSQSLIRWLVRSSTLAWYEAGETICHEGDEGDAMFLIVSGEVAIGPRDGNPERALARLHDGDFFGEIALVQQAPRTASAVALRDAEILVVARASFDVLDERSTAFAHAVRLTAQRRLELNVAGRRDPELVWLVNGDERCRGDRLAALLAQALDAEGARVAEPHALRAGNVLRAAIERAADAGAAYVVAYSDGPVSDRLAQHVADRAGSVVFVDGDAAAPFSHLRASFHRVHHVVVAAPDASAPQPVRRDAILVAAQPADLRRARLERLPEPARGGLRRVARAVGRRRVGVALGGGAAWGYAHVALLRALEDAGLPIDMLAGVSMGAIAGAFYASHGRAGLDRLVGAQLEISAAALGAIASTQSVSLFVRRHIPEARLEELALPLATVAVDAHTARPKVFRHGSIATAVRASCSLPGVFAPSVLGGRRYLDGAVRHNVPAAYCIDAGADFVIACDVVPPPGVPRPMRHRDLVGRTLELTQLNRISDTVRSLYWLASDSSQHQASVADAVFSPDLGEFVPWDFPRARAIVARAEEQLDGWLAATVARYRALSEAADG